MKFKNIPRIKIVSMCMFSASLLNAQSSPVRISTDYGKALSCITQKFGDDYDPGIFLQDYVSYKNHVIIVSSKFSYSTNQTDSYYKNSPYTWTDTNYYSVDVLSVDLQNCSMHLASASLIGYKDETGKHYKPTSYDESDLFRIRTVYNEYEVGFDNDYSSSHPNLRPVSESNKPRPWSYVSPEPPKPSVPNSVTFSLSISAPSKIYRKPIDKLGYQIVLDENNHLMSYELKSWISYDNNSIINSVGPLKSQNKQRFDRCDLIQKYSLDLYDKIQTNFVIQAHVSSPLNPSNDARFDIIETNPLSESLSLSNLEGRVYNFYLRLIQDYGVCPPTVGTLPEIIETVDGKPEVSVSSKPTKRTKKKTGKLR